MPNNIAIKICGLKTKQAVTTAIEAGADYIGCVFYPPSPRHIEPDEAARITELVAAQQKVAVTVNATDAELDAIMTQFSPGYIQLHGDESIEHAAKIKQKYGVKIIKAFKVRSGDDIASSLSYMEIADMVLFDAKAPEIGGMLPGGNGLSFDWQLLAHRTFSKPWFLSGGLNKGNIAEALHITGAPAIDVSSGVESAPGEKDLDAITTLIEEVRNYEQPHQPLPTA